MKLYATLLLASSALLYLSACVSTPHNAEAEKTITHKLEATKVDEQASPLHPAEQALLWVKTADPEKDALKAIKSGEQKFWAYGGRSGFKVPGIALADKAKALTYGTKTTNGMSDVVYGPEHIRLRQEFIRYAEKYNRTLKSLLKF